MTRRTTPLPSTEPAHLTESTRDTLGDLDLVVELLQLLPTADSTTQGLRQLSALSAVLGAALAAQDRVRTHLETPRGSGSTRAPESRLVTALALESAPWSHQQISPNRTNATGVR